MRPTIAVFLLALLPSFVSAEGVPVMPQEDGVYISEIMAANVDTIQDRDGEFVDWLEIHNPTETAITLTGWYLTDNADKRTKFQLPSLTVEPGGYEVIFASGKAGNSPFRPEIHTNFKLRLEGEYLALVRPDGETLVHAFAPYPKQRPGVSHGVQFQESVFEMGACRSATPGRENDRFWLGQVADTKFSVDRGLFSEPFEVAITTATEDAMILYTTDGREPSLGSVFTGVIGEVYERPLTIATTTILRAKAVRKDWLATDIDTQTYLFPHEVPNQPDEPEGFPATWQGADYGMDQDPAHLPLIAGDESLTPEASKAVIGEALKALPTLSLVLPVNDLFSRRDGIYHNSEGRGLGWERAASVELIHPDGSAGFQVDAGLRMQGFTSRNPARNPKHSLRLLFKERYGLGKLRYPLFGEDAATAFETVVLRSNAQDAWVYDTVGNRVGQFVRDEWNRRVQSALGWPACHGTWVHLYLNGLYWGVYNPTERPDDAFMASYYGGEDDDFDIVKNHEEIIRGDDEAFVRLLGMVQNNASRFASGYQDFTSDAAYFALQGRDPDGTLNPDLENLLDVPSMIDYMIPNMYAAAEDWPGNFYMGRDRMGASGGFKFLSWDNEHGQKSSVNENRTAPHRRDEDSPTKFHHPLRDNAEYRLLFADHLHRAFFNEGVLATDPKQPQWDPDHPERNRPAALWMEITDEIEEALIAESARWGDYRRGAPYTVSKDFRELRESLLEDWFPKRSAIVLEQFRQQGLYPDLEAPIFNQHGGSIPSGFLLSMRSKNGPSLFVIGGKMFYTTDGSDPRLLGGAINERSVREYVSPVALTESVTIRARLLREGAWTALNEAVFEVKEDGGEAGFEEWIGDRDPNGDPDHDGLSHLVEYALARDLRSTDAWSEISMDGNGVSLSHQVRKTNDITIGFETSWDLKTWAAADPESLVFEDLQEGVSWRTVRFAQDAGWRFLRLVVTR